MSATEVETMVRPVVEAAGLELVDVAFAREAGRRVLRVTVDREGALDLDTISTVSERVSRRLDLEGFNPGPYQLEVSSPGLERPLRSPREFARHVGRKVKVRSVGLVDGARTHTGTLVAATEDTIRVATDAGERELSYADVSSARTLFEWGGGR